MAAVTTTALAPCAPSPPSVSVFFNRAWMLSIVFLQLMKRSKFSFTCAPPCICQESYGLHAVNRASMTARSKCRCIHTIELCNSVECLLLRG